MSSQPFLQFLVDLQFVFEEQEALVQQPPDAYLKQLVNSYSPNETSDALRGSSADAASEDPLSPAAGDRPTSGESLREEVRVSKTPEEERLLHREVAQRAAESFLSLSPPERAERLKRDIQVFSELLQVGASLASLPHERRGV